MYISSSSRSWINFFIWLILALHISSIVDADVATVQKYNITKSNERKQMQSSAAERTAFVTDEHQRRFL